jgi:peptide/nickel transport system permease protein
MAAGNITQSVRGAWKGTTHPVWSFTVRRVLAIPVLLLIISFLVFSLTYLAPGSPVTALLGGRPSTPQAIAQIEREYHLNGSLLQRYGSWLGGVVHLHLGDSIRTSQPVTQVISSSLGVTIYLAIYAFIITILFGVGLGFLAALRSRRATDRIISGASVIGISAPAFATGIILLYVFAEVLRIFPVYGLGTGFFSELWHLTLPAIALAVSGMALVVKLTRASLIEVLERDYVLFARARGISRPRILLSYVLRNGMIPVVTAGGLIVIYLLTSAVLVEVTFAIPGTGSLLVESIAFKDLPVIQGLTLALAVLILATNLVTDGLYLLLDPRIRGGLAWQRPSR